jgi:hypothetical protein
MTAIGKGFAFLHVPKTGGTWAIRAMEAAGVSVSDVGAHADLDTIRPYGDLFRFAFVREPLSWYRSFWSHRHTFHDWDEDGYLDQVGRAPFEDFLNDAMARYPGYLVGLFELFTGPVGAEIEFVGRYESLVDDLVEALRRAGQSFDEDALRNYPAWNVSSHNLEMRCSAELANRLKEAEYPVYERFYPEHLRGTKSVSQTVPGVTGDVPSHDHGH